MATLNEETESERAQREEENVRLARAYNRKQQERRRALIAGGVALAVLTALLGSLALLPHEEPTEIIYTAPADYGSGGLDGGSTERNDPIGVSVALTAAEDREQRVLFNTAPFTYDGVEVRICDYQPQANVWFSNQQRIVELDNSDSSLEVFQEQLFSTPYFTLSATVGVNDECPASLARIESLPLSKVLTVNEFSKLQGGDTVEGDTTIYACHYSAGAVEVAAGRADIALSEPGLPIVSQTPRFSSEGTQESCADVFVFPPYYEKPAGFDEATQRIE